MLGQNDGTPIPTCRAHDQELTAPSVGGRGWKACFEDIKAANARKGLPAPDLQRFFQ